MLWDIRTVHVNEWESRRFESPSGTTPEEAVILSPLAEEFADCTVDARPQCDERWYIMRDGRVAGHLHIVRERYFANRFDPSFSLHGGKGAPATRLGRHIYR